MAIDLNEEMRRPVSLGLAALAVIGWVVAVCVWATLSTQSSRQQDRITEMQSRNEQLADELKQQRDAAGSLADIQAKREAAEAAVSTAQSDLAAAQKNREEVTAEVTRLRGEADKAHQQGENSRLAAAAAAARSRSAEA